MKSKSETYKIYSALLALLITPCVLASSRISGQCNIMKYDCTFVHPAEVSAHGRADDVVCPPPAVYKVLKQVHPVRYHPFPYLDTCVDAPAQIGA